MSSKLAVITGGSKGIGRSLVEKFCKEGYDVVTCARDAHNLNAMKMSLEKLGGMITGGFVDMSNRPEVLSFANTIIEMDRKVDVLINNVGLFIPGSIIDEPEGQLETQMETNLYSAYYLTRELLPIMQTGHIFNICSTASIAPYKNGSSYSITKYALLGFSHNLREEVKEQGIRVTAVLPGNTLTPSWGETDIPENKFIKSGDVADTIYSLVQLSNTTDVEQVLIQPQFKA